MNTNENNEGDGERKPNFHKIQNPAKEKYERII